MVRCSVDGQTFDVTIKRTEVGFHGGLASAFAACFTHPLDLLKVHLQTQAKTNIGMAGMARNLWKTEGLVGFYTGLSASVMRQLTYSTTRFAMFTMLKQKYSTDGQPVSFYQRIAFASLAGACGGFVGTPADLVNVRMQNDMKLPVSERRGYRHFFDGFIRTQRSEGLRALFFGWDMATGRAVLMTIGQIAFYDQAKQMLVDLANQDPDHVTTHLTASTLAAAGATLITQPFDVLKTRLMNSKPNEYRSFLHCAGTLAKESGPIGFYKGLLTAFVRLAPHTILTFVFFEQLRLNAGGLNIGLRRADSAD